MLVLPRRMAPASLSFAQTVASRSGIKLVRSCEPAVVRIPAVWKLSFKEMGIPCRGPRSRRVLEARGGQRLALRFFGCVRGRSPGSGFLGVYFWVSRAVSAGE